jgi:hypothetical protein
MARVIWHNVAYGSTPNEEAMAVTKRIFTIGQTAVELGTDPNAVAGTIKFLGLEAGRHPLNALAKLLTEDDVAHLRHIREVYQRIRAGRETRAAEAGPVAAPAPTRRKRRCRSTRARG